MKSKTVEDVFCINERNRNIYIKCTTKTSCKLNCTCYYNQLVIPNAIGRNDFNRKLSNKMYICPNEDICTICMDNINTKSDAYLSDCGHPFHKKCFSNYFQHIQIIGNTNLKCPMCRTNLGAPCFYEKYNMYNFDANALDMLENANELCIDMLHICSDENALTKHYLGTNKTCVKCKIYQDKGQLF
jgi:hypothetical protein